MTGEAEPTSEVVTLVDYLRRYVQGGGFLCLPGALDDEAILQALTRGNTPF